ncbi:MAG: hypothetical protein M1544_03120 [Candidatus Marsarchaeota archaeon]|nr:hypothetical protein [Candidatus Marsarchaeota archaeon]MCL5102319.1 hypothetical protein [Candidatus Marsarchaeota archaeon]
MPAKLITINIRRYLVTQPRSRRQKRLSSYVRERIAHYTKLKEENVKLDLEMNKALVKFYSKHMLPIKTSVNVENGVAKASLYSEKKPEAPVVPKGKAAAKEQKQQQKAPEKKQDQKAAEKPSEAKKPDQKQKEQEQKPKKEE